MVLFFRFKELRLIPFRLIFYMIIADFFHSIGLILPYFLNDDLCQAQGYIISYFSLSTILWSAFIAHMISKTVIDKEIIAKYEIYYIFFGFVLPPICFLSNIYEEYTVALGWCWISQTADQNSKGYYI